jgi:hypothetical protein
VAWRKDGHRLHRVPLNHPKTPHRPLKAAKVSSLKQLGPIRTRKGDRWHTDLRSGSSSTTAHSSTRPRSKRPGVSWKAGDTIAIGRRTLRVLGVRLDDADQPPALVVEDLPGSATSDAG